LGRSSSFSGRDSFSVFRLLEKKQPMALACGSRGLTHSLSNLQN
jgi:hypothetical protein